MHGMDGRLAFAGTHPSQSSTNGVHRFADGSGLNLDQIDVFGIPQGLLEEQLVDGCAAAKGDALG